MFMESPDLKPNPLGLGYRAGGDKNLLKKF